MSHCSGCSQLLEIEELLKLVSESNDRLLTMHILFVIMIQKLEETVDVRNSNLHFMCSCILPDFLLLVEILDMLHGEFILSALQFLLELVLHF